MTTPMHSSSGGRRISAVAVCLLLLACLCCILPSAAGYSPRSRRLPSKLTSFTPPNRAAAALRSAFSHTRASEAHQRANKKAARKRAGKYAAHLPSATRLDFGCGADRCECPLPITASFKELRAEGYKLRSEQRLQESAACFAQAMHTYLSRVGRYYVPKGSQSGSLSSTPLNPPSDAPVKLEAHSEAHSEAHTAAQAIMDKLNRGPEEGWSGQKRRAAPSVAQLQELAKASDLVDAELSAIGGTRGAGNANLHRSDSRLPSAPPRRPGYKPWDPASVSPVRGRAIARLYEAQLREQWTSWGHQQEREMAQGNKPGQDKRRKAG